MVQWGEDWSVMAKKEKKPTDKLADKTALTKFLQGVFGDAQKRVLKRMWRRAQEVTALEPKYEKMSDEELAHQTEVFKKRINKALKQADADSAEKKVKPEKKARKNTGKKHQPVDDKKILNELLPEVFAVAREAAKRILGMRDRKSVV